MIIPSLVIKIAFIYTSDRMTFIHGSNYTPTYRVSIELFPKVKPPHFSAAISEVDKEGRIKPVLIYRPGR